MFAFVIVCVFLLYKNRLSSLFILSVSDPECSHCYDIASQGPCKVSSIDKTNCINNDGLYCSYDTVLLQHCRIKGKYILNNSLCDTANNANVE